MLAESTLHWFSLLQNYHKTLCDSKAVASGRMKVLSGVNTPAEGAVYIREGKFYAEKHRGRMKGGEKQMGRR